MSKQAKLIKAYLDEVCDDLDRRKKFRSWKRFKRAAAAVPMAMGLTVAVASCSDEDMGVDDPSTGGTGGQATGGAGGTGGETLHEYDCTNGVDDDHDGYVDCADDDCFTTPNCNGTLYGIPYEMDCDDGYDDDHDGDIDCADIDCSNDPHCT